MLATAAAIALAGVGTADAATHAAPFAAQVKAAHLDNSQATALQNWVDQILHQYKGARQVAANEISLPGGGSVLLPLPGAVNLGFAPATAADSVRPDSSSCPYEYFCMWQGETWSGEQFNVSTCNEDQGLPGSGWDGVGSYNNNETQGTSAFLLDQNKNVIATIPQGLTDYAPLGTGLVRGRLQPLRPADPRPPMLQGASRRSCSSAEPPRAGPGGPPGACLPGPVRPVSLCPARAGGGGLPGTGVAPPGGAPGTGRPARAPCSVFGGGTGSARLKGRAPGVRRPPGAGCSVCAAGRSGVDRRCRPAVRPAVRGTAGGRWRMTRPPPSRSLSPLAPFAPEPGRQGGVDFWSSLEGVRGGGPVPPACRTPPVRVGRGPRSGTRPVPQRRNRSRPG